MNRPRLDRKTILRLRGYQEVVARYALTTVVVACLGSFCIGLGEITPSTAFGLLFGGVFAAIPTAWLWVRELQEVDVLRERDEIAGETTNWSAETARDDDATDGPHGDDSGPRAVDTSPGDPAPWRPTGGGD